MRKAISIQFFIGLLLIAFFNFFCNNATDSAETSPYLNHHDSVQYVGKESCRACHQSIYESFIETGMGQSFGRASKSRSSANFHQVKPIYDTTLNFYYLPKWIGDSMYVLEYRLQGKDTVYQRLERVDYIIGSGQHTNSHLTSTNGFIYQLPLTWYAQQKRWDLPPGFENGRNVRFSRAIEFECMSCHNAMPEIAPGSANKFTKIPDGIDCERCHGPGEVHVWDKLQGNIIDTSKFIDYTIVNPRKLPWERQIDICQRCHLQGNAVLQPGKSFADFKPGMDLGKVLQVYMPKYKGAEDEFIMASHAQRLQQSACFIGSNKETKMAKQDANFNTLQLTCITCHNPHVSVKVTGKETFNNACIKCHTENICTEEKSVRMAQMDNCVTCHMPQSGSVDIPHVTVHDHKIKIPVKKEELKKIKEFAGIYCVNVAQTNELSKAKASLNYFEKFEGEASILDTAQTWIQSISDLNEQAYVKIHFYYLKGNWSALISAAKTIQIEKEKDAWTCYRIGQAYQNIGKLAEAEQGFKQALNLANENLNFMNKLAALYVQQGKFNEAKVNFEKSLSLQAKQSEAWVNYGFCLANLNEIDLAFSAYQKALQLDPDLQQAWLNMASLYLLKGNQKEAVVSLKKVLQLNPNQLEVKALLNQLTTKK
ncbi:MAG: tetratricopeptide repeat protein [Bacteroidota bacterium]|nr:tetratricopeptide repeat protein [Bacteroidota bacterium]